MIWHDPDILIGGKFNMFPCSILHLFLCWKGAKVYSETRWGLWPDFLPGSATEFVVLALKVTDFSGCYSSQTFLFLL